MVQKGDDGSFTGGTDFLRLVGSFLFSSGLVAVVGRAAGDDFTGDLAKRSG
jgi:hypothetical protein